LTELVAGQKPYSIRIFFECHALPSLKKSKRKDPFPPSMNARLHWAQRAKISRMWRERVVYFVGRSKPPKPLRRAHLTLIRHSSVQCDPDNLVASFKPLIDGLKDAGVLADDRDITFKPLWQKAAPGKGAIEIIVESA
jgi:Holliday junction resolvase RusA-like endonuclease